MDVQYHSERLQNSCNLLTSYNRKFYCFIMTFECTKEVVPRDLRRVFHCFERFAQLKATWTRYSIIGSSLEWEYAAITFPERCIALSAVGCADSLSTFNASINAFIMIPYLLLLFAASTIATNSSRPLHVPIYATRCVPTPSEPYIAHFHNPSALDCLNVAAFILATTPNHADPIRISDDATVGQIQMPWFRESGTCQIKLEIAGTKRLYTSSFDEILRIMLGVVGTCLLNNRPLAEQWGGSATFGFNSNLALLLSGTQKVGEAGGALGNETLASGDFGALVEDLAQS